MSTFKVEIVSIGGLMPHPNADRLDIVQVNDWQCVSAKGNFKQGDLAIYIPVDSILPPDVECKIFGPDAKVKLNNSRVRTIKLRGAISQGMVVKPELFNIEGKAGKDVTKILGITKYEPKVEIGPRSNNAAASKKQINPNFRKYTGIENAKNYPNIFEEGEEVIVSEKIHGTNFRCGYVKFNADTLWKKLKSFLKIAPEYEFVFGSHNVQLQNKLLYKGFYDSNVYAQAVAKYNLKEILKPGEVVYGEIYGDGIQKGYNYGCKPGERKAVFFEMMVEGKFIDPIAAKKWFEARQLPFVPVLYAGPFNKQKVLTLRDGDSVLCPEQKIREGVVVRSVKEDSCYIGRKILKFISDNYLLKNQDDETIAH